MDENAIFYLRSRGIPHEAARDVILSAFTNGTIESMHVKEIREYCENLLAEWFTQRKLAEKG